MDRRQIAARWLALLVTLALAAAACGGSNKDEGGQTSPTSGEAAQSDTIVDEGKPVDGGELVIGIDAETAGWKPGADQWAYAGALVGSAVLEPLAMPNAEGGADPWLATAWEPNDTFDEWTITLREGVTFHDGTPFDAAAAKANFDYYRAAPLASLVFGPIIGDTDVVDDHTILVHLESPWASFPTSYLASQSSIMQAPAGIPADSDASQHPIGTGPFVFDEWIQDDHFRATKNPEYWREGEPHLDAIDFRVITDAPARAASLQSGDVDMMVTFSATDAARLEGDFTVLRDWDVIPATIIANTRPEVGGAPNPASNLHARLAMAQAIDTTTIAAVVGDGVLVPSSPSSPSTPWAPEDDVYPAYDPDAARAEVQAYLDETGESELSITINSTPDVTEQTVLAAVREQFDAVGIKSELNVVEQTALINDVIAANYEFLFISQYSSIDPDQNHHYWDSATAPGEGGININFTGFYNDVTEEAIKTGRESDDFDTRHAAYDDLYTEMNKDAVTLWLYYQPYSIISSDDVGGLTAIDAVPFANYNPKPWLSQLWLKSGS